MKIAKRHKGDYCIGEAIHSLLTDDNKPTPSYFGGFS
jgi:hypothetical protein